MNKRLHAHGTSLLNDQPLVDAVVMEVVCAGQHLDQVIIGDGVVADGAVVDLYLGGVAGTRAYVA